MSFYFPQAVVTLKVRWENFGLQNRVLQQDAEFSIIPKSLDVHINDYKQADTFSCEFDYRNFPIDPRYVKSIGVTIEIQDTGGLETEISLAKSNVIFCGFADTQKIQFNESTRTVTIEGRDYTSLFIDIPVPADISKWKQEYPVDVMIEKLLSKLVSTQKIKVVKRPANLSIPTLASYRPGIGQNQPGGAAHHAATYWDCIQEWASEGGLIAFIDLDKLVLSTPRNLYQMPDSEKYHFVYGRNLKNLSFERKLGRPKGLNVMVRSLDPSRKAAGVSPVLIAKIPEEADQEWCNAMGIARERQRKVQPVAPDSATKPTQPGAKAGINFVEVPAPFISFVVPNIKDLNQLKRIGQGVWELYGRQQIEGSLETKDMGEFRYFTSKNEANHLVEFDFRKIRMATPIVIKLHDDENKKIAEMNESGAIYRFLVERNYPANVAGALSALAGKAPITFYTRGVHYSLNSSGFAMKLDFVNFIDTKEVINE